MSPDQAIAALDRQLQAHGQTVKVRHAGQAYELRAFVRGVAQDPTDIGGGITQNERLVVLSPTGLRAAGWPAGADTEEIDAVTVDGRIRGVDAVVPVSMADVVVRYDVTIRG
ncbi:hypothetical protein [Methylobacterium platani]|uniref:Uncharacterized protein n=2 Tax=Methylobacterium platani TaxID=427683 RepID=A0A179SFQ2_9HYPH|nr:hypothetical protein [Methylobacterium platani]KMO20380.1 hypothetical protein SQ03_05685 [Methylobacterium platani JCM 14648]OAS26289.1 hypothetical protein A5481_06110 [Methylobacterium platani]